MDQSWSKVSVCSRIWKSIMRTKLEKWFLFALVCNNCVWKAMKCVKILSNYVQFWRACFLIILPKIFFTTFVFVFGKPQQQPNFLFGYFILIISSHQDFLLWKIISDWLTTDILILCHLPIVFCFTLMFPRKVCIQQQATPEFWAQQRRTVSQPNGKDCTRYFK